ncbi:MAG TPA: DUF87 domain-containing protein [Solirubrobacteraceae bacterium]
MSIDAAVNLTEDRRFHSVAINERLATAVNAQRAFLNGLLDPALNAVIDLRIIRDPTQHQLRTAILVRAMGGSEPEARKRAGELLGTLTASMPDHVIARVVETDEELQAIRDPFGDTVRDAAFVSREEITAVPVRQDIRRQFAYLYGVVPFHVTAVDWAPLYQRLVACEEPVAVSVALHPRRTPPQLAALLGQYATLYGQWAQSDRSQGGIYTGEQSLPAEAFAVDASAAFMDYSQRLSQRCFAMRSMIASSESLPVGLAQTFGGTISPVDDRDEDHLRGRRASSAYRLRDDASAADLARWDLQTADLRVPAGAPTIWRQPAPPPDALADLAILGDAREAGCAFRLPIALSGDLAGIRIRRGRSGHTEAMDGGLRPIYLGSVDESGGRVHVEANSLSKHALVAGSTGSGKTTLVLGLLRQLWPPESAGLRRIPFLVIEPVNDDADDYRKLLTLPEFEHELDVYTVGDERTRPLRFNPFVVPTGALVGEHMSAMLAAFKAAFGLWDPLPAIYEEAIADTYAVAGILPSETAGDVEPRRWPTVIGFLEAMRRATAGLGYQGDVRSNLEAASVIRAKQLAFGPCASAFRTDRGLDVERLLERPTIVELKTLGSVEEQALMIAFLLNAITEHYKANRGAQSELQHVTVIEEAHRLLSRAKGSGGGSAQGQAREQAAEAFANVLAENRKYGEGIVIAEQIPSKLVEDAVKNTNLKVMCRLTSEEEREYLGLSMAMSTEQRLAAARLVIGEAMVFSDELPNTMEVRTPRLAGEDGQSFEMPAALPIDRVPPFDLCTLCPAQCQWRAAGLAVSRRPRVLARATALTKLLRAPKDGERPETAARALVKSVLAETGRYPWIQAREGVEEAAICGIVHSLESRVQKERWAEWCVKEMHRQAAATPQ